jgi:hypothetical protein
VAVVVLEWRVALVVASVVGRGGVPVAQGSQMREVVQGVDPEGVPVTLVARAWVVLAHQVGP